MNHSFGVGNGIIGVRRASFDECREWFLQSGLTGASVWVELSTPTDDGSIVSEIFITRLEA